MQSAMGTVRWLQWLRGIGRVSDLRSAEEVEGDESEEAEEAGHGWVVTSLTLQHHYSTDYATTG